MDDIARNQSCVEGDGVRRNRDVEIFDSDSSPLQLGLDVSQCPADFVRPIGAHELLKKNVETVAQPAAS